MTDVQLAPENLVIMPKVEFKPKFISESLAPAYETSRSACFDLRADIENPIGGEGWILKTLHVIPTGLYLSQTEGKQLALMADSVRLKLRIEEKSSLALKGWTIKAGIVDSDYPNEIMVLAEVPAEIVIQPGDKIAQASWEMVFVGLGVETKDVTRIGGFGSTK